MCARFMLNHHTCINQAGESKWQYNYQQQWDLQGYGDDETGNRQNKSLWVYPSSLPTFKGILESKFQWIYAISLRFLPLAPFLPF